MIELLADLCPRFKDEHSKMKKVCERCSSYFFGECLSEEQKRYKFVPANTKLKEETFDIEVTIKRILSVRVLVNANEDIDIGELLSDDIANEGFVSDCLECGDYTQDEVDWLNCKINDGWKAYDSCRLHLIPKEYEKGRCLTQLRKKGLMEMLNIAE